MIGALAFLFLIKVFPFTKFSPSSFKLKSSRTKGGENMNAKMKKTFFWGALLTPIVLGVYFLVGGYSALAAGPHGHDHGQGGVGPRGGFEGHHVVYAPQPGDGFSWMGWLLFLIVGVAVLFFLVKWHRKKAKATAMQQFIDTSIMSSHKPMTTKNESILDQWEKNLTNKKEND
jgi:hypothetical protein